MSNPFGNAFFPWKLQPTLCTRHPKNRRLILRGDMKRGRCELCDLQNAKKLKLNSNNLSRNGIFKYMSSCKQSDTFSKYLAKKLRSQILQLKLLFIRWDLMLCLQPRVVLYQGLTVLEDAQYISIINKIFNLEFHLRRHKIQWCLQLQFLCDNLRY